MEQIIDEFGNISPNLDLHLKNLNLYKAQLDYNMISIIGVQSSGKSTLMNNLFNTKFQTMNRTIGRQQTTKGIHAATNKSGKILLFDIEGSDSRERGDSDALFREKISSFCPQPFRRFDHKHVGN